MSASDISRRSILGDGFLEPSVLSMASVNAGEVNNFSDPSLRFTSKLKTIGSLAEETVHRVSTGHVWMYEPETHKFEPFCSLENYNVSEWSHAPDGKIISRMFESAVYMKFGTDEVMEEWINPYTNEVCKVHHYLIGPMISSHDPNASDLDSGAGNAERVIIPNNLDWVTIGDTVYMPTDSSVDYKNPLQPEEWPLASAGPTFGWDSFIMFASKTSDLLNTDISQVMAHSWYQENIRWQPWMLMGQRPGRLIARGYGKKVRWDEIPVDRVKRMEKYVGEVLDRANWEDFQNEFIWYLKNQKPRRSDVKTDGDA